MIEIKAPNKIKTNKFSIFLAGSTDTGKAEDWQKKVVNDLKDFDIYLYNPRRDDWDSSWKQEIENEQFYSQVTWELDGLDKADLIIINFSKDSKAPITFFELGANLNKNIFLCCPDGFYRKGNIDIYVEYYNIKNYFDNYNKMIDAVKEEIKNKELKENKMKHTFNENVQSFIDISLPLMNASNGDGKTQISEFVKLMSSNKVLKEQLNLFRIINEGIEVDEINETVKQLVSNSIMSFKLKYQPKQIKEANNLLNNFMVENNIKVTYTNNEVEEALTKILNSEGGIQSINEDINNSNIITNNLKVKKKSNNVNELMESFSSFNINSLNENDQKTFKKIMLANTTKEKEELFNETRNECITIINNLYSEAIDLSEKERLLNHKENLLNKVMTEENYQKELRKLLEYKNILNNI